MDKETLDKVRERAKTIIREEEFEKEVEKEIQRLKTKKPLLHKLFPWEIRIRRRK